MKPKNIRRKLRGIFDEFLESIEDKDVAEDVSRNTIISGGAIVSLLQDTDPSDYDLYFTNKQTVLKVARYYVNKLNENSNKNRFGYKHKALLIDGAFNIQQQIIDQGEEPWETAMLKGFTEDRVKIVIRSDGVNIDLNDVDVEEEKEPKDKKFQIKFVSTNAISLYGKIQLIIRFYGPPEEIHKNFDYVHCLSYWDTKDNLVLNKDALSSILTKELIFTGSRYPLCSLFRLRKFIKRGWWISAGEILKIAMSLNELDLKDPIILEDQLIGVDTMYFFELIEMLREKEVQITSSYITTLVDRIFH
ncbi:MAG: hypothetical protein RBS96_02625 [Dehalococcoidales bacterium]|jgi:hypothetical protein|nr:hypothetical protein [Dehalococcoidales bacterium]